MTVQRSTTPVYVQTAFTPRTSAETTASWCGWTVYSVAKCNTISLISVWCGRGLADIQRTQWSLLLDPVCRSDCEITCYNSQATWLFWYTELRRTFRRCLRCVHRRRTATCTSLLRHDHCWRRMDGLCQDCSVFSLINSFLKNLKLCFKSTKTALADSQSAQITQILTLISWNDETVVPWFATPWCWHL